MSSPKVTILMSVYNREKYLEQAVSSILGQTFTDFEFLIVNDGSTDRTAEILKSFKDSRIILINNPENLGIIKSLNKAIPYIKGEYVARMDSDDIALPERLEKEIMVFESKPEIDVVAAQILPVNHNGIKTGAWSADTYITSSENIHRLLPKECCIANPTVMLRSSLLREYSYSLYQQEYAEDWNLWLRMASDGRKFIKINEILLKYRMHPSSVSVKQNRNGLYKNRYRVQVKYCLHKIKKLRFNSFDFRVLCNALSNYINHFLSFLKPNLPEKLHKIFSTNVVKVIIQYLKVTYFKIPDEANVFLFIPYNAMTGNLSKYMQVARLLDKEKTFVFITDRGNSVMQESNMLNISSVASYPYINKWLKSKIWKHICSVNSPIMVGYNSQLYYHLLKYADKKVKCIDIFDDTMNVITPGNGLIYNYGIWSIPYIERLDNRFVLDEEALKEIKDIHNLIKIKPELLNRMEYISNFICLKKKIEKL